MSDPQVCSLLLQLLGFGFWIFLTVISKTLAFHLQKNLEEKKPKLEREARDRSKQQTEARRKR